MKTLAWFFWMSVALVMAGCSHTADLPISAGTGPDPVLPPPADRLIPTVNVAPAIGWPAGGRPTAAAGTQVHAFAADLDHPRWIYVLPNGDVLVAESNAPAEAGQDGGIRGWIMQKMMKKAGAGVPSADRITLLRDKDGDGTVDLRTVFLDELHSPFGMALVDGDFSMWPTRTS